MLNICGDVLECDVPIREIMKKISHESRRNLYKRHAGISQLQTTHTIAILRFRQPNIKKDIEQSYLRCYHVTMLRS